MLTPKRFPQLTVRFPTGIPDEDSRFPAWTADIDRESESMSNYENGAIPAVDG